MNKATEQLAKPPIAIMGLSLYGFQRPLFPLGAWRRRRRLKWRRLMPWLRCNHFYVSILWCAVPCLLICGLLLSTACCVASCTIMCKHVDEMRQSQKSQDMKRTPDSDKNVDDASPKICLSSIYAKMQTFWQQCDKILPSFPAKHQLCHI